LLQKIIRLPWREDTKRNLAGPLLAAAALLLRCKEAKKTKQKTLAQFFRKKNKEPEAVVFFVIGLLRLLCT
jgi:hypothetical protein